MTSVSDGPPTGTVTFLFTDVEGSTRLLQELGAGYDPVQRDHLRLMREAIAAGEGTEIGTEGDSFFAVFRTPTSALHAVVAAQRALAAHEWPHSRPLRVRMGIHTGEGRLEGGSYLGIAVNVAARIAAAGNGGQVLLSDATRALVQHDLPEGVRLRDLGTHRLKDIAHPQHLYDLVIEGLSADFPPVRTLEVPSNLPDQLTSFVGRERELAEVGRLLTSSRLVTLTGPGGSGKTRLSLQAASSVAGRFPDGIFFVELAAIEEPHLVPSVIATALGLKEEGPRPVLETLQSELRERTALLVLDNFEQLIAAAPVVASLLAAPKIRILVTSRTVLHVQGEQEFPVPPLEVPDPVALPPLDALSRNDAVALFVARAVAVDPSFSLGQDNARMVVEICARLDGLPLAIELAASRIRLLGPKGMLERLDHALPLLTGGARDLPARQRTLRGAIAWSDELLTTELRALFHRLAVFAGGFDVEAAQSVCDPDAELGVETLDGLQALLDNSLVRPRPGRLGDVRFEMLQTIREYGLERIEADGDAEAIGRRHAEYFLALADRAERELRGPHQEAYLDLLELEHDNLRAALTWAIHRGQAEPSLLLVWALWRFWHLRGHLSAGRRWATEALALPSAQGRTAARAKALGAAGGLAYWQTDAAVVRTAYEEALAIWRELKDEHGIAEATANLAFAYALDRNMPEAVSLFREARGMFATVGDVRGVADMLFALSVTDRLSGNLPSARSGAEEALRLHRQLDDRFGITGSTFALGRALFELGEVDSGRAQFLDGLEAAALMRDRTGMAIALDNLADLENAGGRPQRAMRLAGASESVKAAVGGEAPPAMVHLPDPREVARRLLSEAEIEASWADGRAMTLEEALAYAREPL